MAFRDDLLKAGYRKRYHTATFTFRAEDEDLEDEDEIEAEEEVEGDVEDDEDDEEETDPSDGLNLSGLAVPFNEPTRIDNFFEGTFDEQFLRGSFKRTIGMGGQVMLFEHGQHPMFGSLPIAEIRSLRETDRGLEYRARMFDNWLTEPLQDAIRANGAITGNSIQFRSLKEEIEERDGDVPLVSVMEADLRELGPVLFPAYGGTDIDLRKKIVEDVRRSFESALANCDGGSRGAKQRGRRTTGPGSTHPVSRSHYSLAIARLTILELDTHE